MKSLLISLALVLGASQSQATDELFSQFTLHDQPIMFTDILCQDPLNDGLTHKFATVVVDDNYRVTQVQKSGWVFSECQTNTTDNIANLVCKFEDARNIEDTLRLIQAPLSDEQGAAFLQDMGVQQNDDGNYIVGESIYTYKLDTDAKSMEFSYEVKFTDFVKSQDVRDYAEETEKQPNCVQMPY